jgi:16S rRNA (uracil1498-N3)-methyltransferase
MVIDPGGAEGLDRRLRAGPLVFVADLAEPALDPVDEHHLRRVLRMGDGAELCCSDGGGRWRPVRLGAALVPDGEIVHAPAAEPGLCVATAVPKGDRPEWLVQKLTEVGIDRIVLLETERSVVRWRGDRADRQLDRLRRIAREAAMQSRRCTVPRIEGPVRPSGLVGPGTVVAEPGGGPLGADATCVLIGPEGGWAPTERDGLGPPIGLGPTILRTETAAVVAGSLLAALRSGLVGPARSG